MSNLDFSFAIIFVATVDEDKFWNIKSIRNSKTQLQQISTTKLPGSAIFCFFHCSGCLIKLNFWKPSNLFLKSKTLFLSKIERCLTLRIIILYQFVGGQKGVRQFHYSLKWIYKSFINRKNHNLDIYHIYPPVIAIYVWYTLEQARWQSAGHLQWATNMSL